MFFHLKRIRLFQPGQIVDPLYHLATTSKLVNMELEYIIMAMDMAMLKRLLTYPQQVTRLHPPILLTLGDY
jgi:hypothetical protein